MKYMYKQTGVIVESESNLDSAIFTPVKDVTKPEEPAVAQKNTTRKRSDKK